VGKAKRLAEELAKEIELLEVSKANLQQAMQDTHGIDKKHYDAIIKAATKVVTGSSPKEAILKLHKALINAGIL